MNATKAEASKHRLLEVTAAQSPPDAVLPASASKSVTHRAILQGVLTSHTCIERPLLAADTYASLQLANALGATLSVEPLTPAANRLLATLHKDGVTQIASRHGPQNGLPGEWEGIPLDTVLQQNKTKPPAPLMAAVLRLHVEGPHPGSTGPMPALPVNEQQVDLGNSGTTLRLGTALAALGDRPITLTGDASLHTRPMAPLVQALKELDVQCEAEGEAGRAPITIQGPLSQKTRDEAMLDGNVSSQFISALLLAGHGAPPLRVRVGGRPASAPYVRLTIETLEQSGGHVDQEDKSTPQESIFQVPAGSRLQASRMVVPGDYSSASFPLVAAAITGGKVTLKGLDPESAQGDRFILHALEQAGCSVQWENDEQPDGPLLHVRAPENSLHAFTLDLNATPDLLPPLGVLAARATGTSRLTGLAHARIKETDRLAATAKGLQALGFHVVEEDDAIEITGDPTLPIPETRIETHSDHRILMSFAVLALTGPGPLLLDHPSCYHVSYPRFRLDLDELGAATRVIDDSDPGPDADLDPDAGPAPPTKTTQGPARKQKTQAAPRNKRSPP